jgi:hypothetical protein
MAAEWSWSATSVAVTSGADKAKRAAAGGVTDGVAGETMGAFRAGRFLGFAFLCLTGGMEDS